MPKTSEYFCVFNVFLLIALLHLRLFKLNIFYSENEHAFYSRKKEKDHP